MLTETTVSPAPVEATTPTPLVDFFSAAEARVDRWRQLAAVVRAWQATPARESAGGAPLTRWRTARSGRSVSRLVGGQTTSARCSGNGHAACVTVPGRDCPLSRRIPAARRSRPSPVEAAAGRVGFRSS